MSKLACPVNTVKRPDVLPNYLSDIGLSHAHFNSWENCYHTCNLRIIQPTLPHSKKHPHYLVFGRATVLPVHLILGIPATTEPQSQLDYSRRTVENLQFAYELARRNLKERADKQATKNEKLSVPVLQPGDQVLIHRPYHDFDGPNPKLYSPWHGPYSDRPKLSPVICRVTKHGAPTETTVHLGRMKKYSPPVTSPVPDLDAIDDVFLGITLPVPDLNSLVTIVTIGPFTVEGIDRHKRGVGAASLANFQYHLKLKEYPPHLGVWRHYRVIPQCREMVESYGAALLSQDPAPFSPPK